jgi:hypothetical protein
LTAELGAEQGRGRITGGMMEEDVDVPDGAIEDGVTHRTACDMYRTWNCPLERFEDVVVMLNLANSVSSSHCPSP